MKCMHANVGSLMKKKKKTKRNEGCEEIQKGGKYDSAEMIKMFKTFYGASSGRGTRKYKHTSLHYTLHKHTHTQYMHAHSVHTLYFFKYKRKKGRLFYLSWGFNNVRCWLYTRGPRMLFSKLVTNSLKKNYWNRHISLYI